MSTAVLGTLVLVLIAIALGGVFIRQVLARLSKAGERARVAERELAALDRRQALAEQDLAFLSRFVREFPTLTRDLNTTLRQRDIARLLLNVVSRTFEPSRAVVLGRRRRLLDEGQRVNRFIVAAVTPETPLQLGAEIAELGAGLDLAVSEQSVVCRRDLPLRTVSPQGGTCSGLEFDLAAPIAFGDEILGLIALSHPARTSDDAKAALKLIAQAGAQALHSSAAYHRVQTTASLDGLTGIFNKRHMTQALGEMIVEAERRQAPLSVFLFDVDNFKHYNDGNGHVAGDQLLKELALLVQENVRQEDVFGRFGGEEFLLLLPATPIAAGLSVAEKVRGLIAAHPFAFGERQPLGRASVSGGVAQYPDDALDSTNLLKAADEALYTAKRAGRNRVLAAQRRHFGGPPLDPADALTQEIANA